MRRAVLEATRGSARRVWANPSGLFVTFGFYVIVVSVIAALWRAAAAANHGLIAGYSGRSLTWYMAASEAATVALNVRMIEYIGTDISDGSVAVEMLRPASVVAIRLASETGQALGRLVALMGMGTLLCLLVVGAPPSWSGLALAAPALVLAVMCNLAMQHAVAAAAFWTRDARTSWFLYQKFVFILGGMLLPLEILPTAVHHVALALPFMAMSYVPARLASGHPDLALMGLQVLWLTVAIGAAVAAFGAGQRRLQVVGG